MGLLNIHSTARAKFVLLFFIVALLIAPAGPILADKLPIGSPCQNDDECKSNDCEDSTLKDNSGNIRSFCDCNEDSDCTDQYGKPNDGGEWDCVDDGPNDDLDYCKSDKNRDIRFPLDAKKPSSADWLTDPEAAEVGYLNEIDNLKPEPAIRVPGLQFSEVLQVKEGDTEYIYIPWIGDYLAALYKFGLAVASLIAISMVIKNGFDIVMMAHEKMEKIKRIGQILVGLMLAWGSYAILYNLNPRLVEFKALKVPIIRRDELPERAASFADRPSGAQGSAPHGKGAHDAADRTACPALTPGTEFKGSFTTYWNIGHSQYGQPGAYKGSYKGNDPSLQGMGDFFCAVSMECGCPKKDSGGSGYGAKVCGSKNPWPVCNYFPREAKWCEKKDYIPGGSVAASTCFPRNCKIETGGKVLVVKDRGSGIVGTHFDLYLGATGDPDFTKDTSWLNPDKIKIVDCPGSVPPAELAKMRASYERRKPGVCRPGFNC